MGDQRGVRAQLLGGVCVWPAEIRQLLDLFRFRRGGALSTDSALACGRPDGHYRRVDDDTLLRSARRTRSLRVPHAFGAVSIAGCRAELSAIPRIGSRSDAHD